MSEQPKDSPLSVSENPGAGMTNLPPSPEFAALCESGAVFQPGSEPLRFTVTPPNPNDTPADVEILACEFYGVVMQATADTWTLWQYADQKTKAGYYDLAYEVAERLRPLMHMEALRDAAQAFPHGEFTADPTVPTWLRRRADLLERVAGR